MGTDLGFGRLRRPVSMGASASPTGPLGLRPEPASSLGHSASVHLRVSPELDPAACGEFLLSYLNNSNRWGYSTRDFERGSFREIAGLAPLLVRTICCGCWANSPGEGDKVSWWRSDELGLDVFLHWDGDGTIVFQCADWTLENGDCKNDHDWEWVTNDHWAIDYGHYEDAPNAVAAAAREGADAKQAPGNAPQSGAESASPDPRRIA